MKHTPFIAFALLVLFACSNETADTPVAPSNPVQLTSQDLQVSNAYNRFGFDLFQELAAGSSTENVFISPMSVSYALGMTMNGADGSTFDEMQNVLQFSGLTQQEINQSYKNLTDYLTRQDPSVTLDIANAIFHRYHFSILDDFANNCRNNFGASIHALDFTSQDAVDMMNSWVANKTNNRIKDIVEPPIDPSVVMYLMNAIYFNGTWKYQFKTDETFPDLFYNADGSQSVVDMMHMECDLPTAEATHYSMVELPYGNGSFSMVIVVPRPPMQLGDLVAEFDADTWASALSALEVKTITVGVPKFTLEYKQALPASLKALGMPEAFTPSADFSKITGVPNIYISDVQHKTFVSVDEAGTEAAAVTSVEMVLTSIQSFTVNQPFLVAIREAHSGSILFIGRINKL